MQEILDFLQNFTAVNLIKIKEKKTNIMKFNCSRSNDFPPELVVQGFGDQLQVVKEAKLLGIILTSDLKWGANTDYLCGKAYRKMWTIREGLISRILSFSEGVSYSVELVRGAGCRPTIW